MFSFFRKSVFLVDYLDGFIDIHNHILPGIDDGAKTVDESIALIKGFSEFGVRHFIATPHIMENYYPNTEETITGSLQLLQNELRAKGIEQVQISAAAEHMIDANFEHLLANDGIMPFKDNYLLIEMSYLQPSLNFDDMVKKIKDKGYFPILAHPERYGYFHNRMRKHRQFRADDIFLQLNLLSLGDFYGKSVQKMALKLLDAGLINFVASDVHNMHQLKSLQELKISEKVGAKLRPLIHATTHSFY